jgi:hypothetical protein
MLVADAVEGSQNLAGEPGSLLQDGLNQIRREIAVKPFFNRVV